MENLYNILGVSSSASTEEIKKAYRTLAMRYHPDRNADAAAARRFNGVQRAYDVLADAAKRAEYNQSFNNRIITDPEAEAYELWSSLFVRYGLYLADTTQDGAAKS
jgi:DnaJ-class molecular chaperone